MPYTGYGGKGGRPFGPGGVPERVRRGRTVADGGCRPAVPAGHRASDRGSECASVADAPVPGMPHTAGPPSPRRRTCVAVAANYADCGSNPVILTVADEQVPGTPHAAGPPSPRRRTL